MTTRSLQLPPAGGTPREVATSVNSLFKGRSDAIGSITLTTGTAVTVITDKAFENVGEDSIISLSPRNAYAGSLGTWVASKGNGTFSVAASTAVAATALFDVSWQG